jgi:hypothetical protein
MNSFTEVPIQKFKTLIKLKNMDSLLNLGCAIQLLNASGSARVFNTFLSERFTLWKSCCVSCSSKFFFFFGGGCWIQGLMLARQALYQPKFSK